MEGIEQFLEAFNTLSDDEVQQLADINDRVQSRNGSWGETKGGDKDENGAIQMPYVLKEPLINEFLEFMYDNHLVAEFDWAKWGVGREWYKSKDPEKYANLDAETALKLLSAVIRNDRFNEGALVSAFESGDFPKIIDRLARLRAHPVR